MTFNIVLIVFGLLLAAVGAAALIYVLRRIVQKVREQGASIREIAAAVQNLGERSQSALDNAVSKLEANSAQESRRIDGALKQQQANFLPQIARLQVLAFDAEFAVRELALHGHLSSRIAAPVTSPRTRVAEYLAAANGRFASQHGHVMMVRSILALDGAPAAAAAPGAPRRKVLEIGTTREVLYTQSSSTKIALVCDVLGLDFVTVDMNPENSAKLRERMGQVSSTAQMVVSEGAKFLRQSDQRFAYAYLDSFDFFHDKHSPARLASYEAYLNLALTDDNSWQHHKEVAELLSSRMDSGGVIVLDDTWRDGEGWAGKGKLAVDLLAANGFEIAHEGATCLVMVKP